MSYSSTKTDPRAAEAYRLERRRELMANRHAVNDTTTQETLKTLAHKIFVSPKLDAAYCTAYEIVVGTDGEAHTRSLVSPAIRNHLLDETVLKTEIHDGYAQGLAIGPAGTYNQEGYIFLSEPKRNEDRELLFACFERGQPSRIFEPRPFSDVMRDIAKGIRPGSTDTIQSSWKPRS